MKFIRGYLLVQVSGFSPERFLNLCANKGILVWNLQKNKGGYIFNISVSGYRLLKPFVKKTGTKIKILDKIGLPFFFYKYRKRKLFFLGIGIFASFLYILSLFIWKIEIVGNYSYTKEMLTKYLSTNSYSVGMWKNNVIGSEIEQKMMMDFQDIAWVSVEVKGTRMILNMQETLERHQFVSEDLPADIVADKEGIITSIVTRRGMPQVVQGDVVKEGDILVSGDILIKMEEVLRDVEFTHSDADIYAKTIYDYNKVLSLDYREKVFTGKVSKGYAFSLFNNKVTMYHPKIKFDKYDKIVKNDTVRIGKDFYLPFDRVTMEYREYYYEDRQYSVEEATEILKSKLQKFIKELEEKGVQILENNVKIVEENNTVESTGRIIVIERIGVDAPINTIERRLKYEDEIIREDDTNTQ
ncbi:hypothetical protein EDC18_101351 [Natranaerovirga pectinivora]|uniref:Sporulation protein YqfD n=1 Tax=Natranaerovirga pectinivora TaxID=682400 RepID=A0A4R3MP44_9FIRM|nr:sporulation protein YqfD [Natranaerovirga pectinivora]TCT17055.1 hypothetical protein EDC18_101351 [Natranaerovirga pectinivora]